MPHNKTIQSTPTIGSIHNIPNNINDKTATPLPKLDIVKKNMSTLMQGKQAHKAQQQKQKELIAAGKFLRVYLDLELKHKQRRQDFGKDLTPYLTLVSNLAKLGLLPRHYLDTDKLIDISEPFKGYCNGLTHMWGQAILAGQQDKYSARLRTLLNNYQKNPARIIDNQTGKFRDANDIIELFYWAATLAQQGRAMTITFQDGSNIDLALLTSIPAFMDGVSLYLRPSYTALHLDHPYSNFIAQNQMEAAQILANQSMVSDNVQGMAQLFSHAFAGNASELSKYMQTLITTCQSLHEPFFITISGFGHVIAISVLNGQFILQDANFMSGDDRDTSLLKDISSIGPAIMERFPKGRDAARSKEACSFKITGYTNHTAVEGYLPRLTQEARTRDKAKLINAISTYQKAIAPYAGAQTIAILKEINQYISNHDDLKMIRDYLLADKTLQQKLSNAPEHIIKFFIFHLVAIIDGQTVPQIQVEYERMLSHALTQGYMINTDFLEYFCEVGEVAVLGSFLDWAKKNQVDLPSYLLPAAIFSGKFSAVKMLINRGFPVSGADVFNAILARNYIALKMLLDTNSQLSNARINGDTALYQAVMTKRLDLVKILHSHGAMIDQANDDGNTALMLATRLQDVEMVKFLLSKGANPDHTSDISGLFARVIAAYYHNSDLQRWMAAYPAPNRALVDSSKATHFEPKIYIDGAWVPDDPQHYHFEQGKNLSMDDLKVLKSWNSLGEAYDKSVYALICQLVSGMDRSERYFSLFRYQGELAGISVFTKNPKGVWKVMTTLDPFNNIAIETQTEEAYRGFMAKLIYEGKKTLASKADGPIIQDFEEIKKSIQDTLPPVYGPK